MDRGWPFQFYKIFTASLASAALAQLLYLIDQAVYRGDGIGVPGAVVVASCARSLARGLVRAWALPDRPRGWLHGAGSIRSGQCSS